MSNKTMTVKEFVEKYKNSKSDTVKDGLMKSIVKRTYCPILEKRIVLQIFLDKSIVEDDNGLKYIDMLQSKLNLTSAIVYLYTTLEIEKDENDVPKVADTYDLLEMSGLMSAICNHIGEAEIEELLSVNKSLIDTFYVKNNSPQALLFKAIDKLGHKIGVVSGAGFEKLSEILDDEKKMNAALKKLNGAAKVLIK